MKIFYSIIFFSILSASCYSEKINEPVLILEPSFLQPPISKLVPGAHHTVIVPAFIENKNSEPAHISLLEPSWKTTRLSWMDHFLEQARKTLSKRLMGLHPRFLRDKNEVIQVAIIESEDPLAASTILAPDFAEQFIPIFGSKFLIAIPTTHRIYIFSKLVSPLASISATIRDDYKLSLSPLSLEIFELGNGELHAIGSLD